MSITMLLIDMFGLHDKATATRVVGAIRDRLGASDWDVYVIRETFFQQRPEGRVAPQQVEEAITDLESEIGESFQGEVCLADFALALIVSPEASPAFIVQVAEEVTERTARMPRVFAAQLDGEDAVLVDARNLPLKWRCQEADIVILAQDVWLPGEGNAEGDLPWFPRGEPLVVVERCMYDGQRVNGAYKDCFLTVAAREEQAMPVSVVLPWQLVAHPSEWHARQPTQEPPRAVAHFQLPCWYHVRAEVTC